MLSLLSVWGLDRGDILAVAVVVVAVMVVVAVVVDGIIAEVEKCE